jgi:hypothetical protein
MDVTSSLAKEALIILFRHFPGQFVLVGGGALHWIFQSPRLSVDLDLKPISPPDDGLIIRIAETLEKELAAITIPLGVRISSRPNPKDQAIQILVDDRPGLHIEFVALVPISGKEKHLLQSDSLRSEIIVTPDLHQLLFAKAAALLKRKQVKGRDVFDIWFLLSRGAGLPREAFAEWLKWEEIDGSDIQARLGQISASRLQADLARFLPESLTKSLAADRYQVLIDAAKRLFRPFL